ncbi:MAG: GNAT family N-acetyltransferase [Promethearchaeota archaeon]
MAAKLFPFITGEIIDLFPLNPNHVSLYSKWENNPQVRKYARTAIPMTIEESKKYIVQSDSKSRKIVMFEIWHKRDQKPIGYCEIGDFSWQNRNAYIGFLIGEIEYWGQKIGTELTKLLVDYGFKELNFHKITAEALSANTGSQRCLEKNGFKHQGTLKEDMFVDGEYMDMLLYGILKKEWKVEN